MEVLCYPGALSIDRRGNLFVSDHTLEVNGNRRLLVFSAESTPVTNSETIFGPPRGEVLHSLGLASPRILGRLVGAWINYGTAEQPLLLALFLNSSYLGTGLR